MTPPDRSQWKRVDVVVPAGPLGLIVSKSPTGEGHVIVDGFRPVGGSAEPGALEKHGEIGPNSLLLGVNAHDFTDAAACWSFEKIREILVSTSSAERVVRFLVPPPPPAVQFEEIAAHEGGKRFADLTTALEELRKFNARRKFRAAVSTVKATISLTKALTLGGSPRSSKDSGDEGEQRTQSAPAVVNGSAVPPPAPTASQ
ncbi:hypothetical protein PC112_g8041 [Phytophthora cactorum]|nr:hypothetical protein PC112_g8041 [Phytophthora cactorum]